MDLNLHFYKQNYLNVMNQQNNLLILMDLIVYLNMIAIQPIDMIISIFVMPTVIKQQRKIKIM